MFICSIRSFLLKYKQHHFTEPTLIPTPFMQVGGLFGQAPPFAPQHQLAPPLTQPPLPPIGQPPAVGPPTLMVQQPPGGIQRPTSLAPGILKLDLSGFVCIFWCSPWFRCYRRPCGPQRRPSRRPDTGRRCFNCLSCSS